MVRMGMAHTAAIHRFTAKETVPSTTRECATTVGSNSNGRAQNGFAGSDRSTDPNGTGAAIATATGITTGATATELTTH